VHFSYFAGAPPSQFFDDEAGAAFAGMASANIGEFAIKIDLFVRPFWFLSAAAKKSPRSRRPPHPGDFPIPYVTRARFFDDFSRLAELVFRVFLETLLLDGGGRRTFFRRKFFRLKSTLSNWEALTLIA
jgi:hypothetical protein